MLIIRLATIIFILFTIGCKEDDSNNLLGPIQIDFEKTYGGFDEDKAHDITTLDNNLFVLGSTKSKDDVNGDLYLLQLDINGNVLTELTFGGNQAEVGYSILATRTNNLLLLGSTKSMGNGDDDIYVVKTDRKGNIQWEKAFGGSQKDTPIDAIETSSGEYCIAGTTESFGAGSRDIYLLWLDQNGNLIRQKYYGGVDIDGSASIIEIENNEIMIYGYTANNGATSRDLYLLKINEYGDSLWSKRFGGNGYEESQSFVKTREKGYLLHGHSSSIDSNHQMYTVKTDSNGSILWEKHFGGEFHDGGQAALIDRWNNYFLIGRSMSFGNGRQIFMVHTNAEGDVLSKHTFGGERDDWGQSIIEFGSYYFIAGHSNSFSNGNDDVYLLRLSR